VTYNDRFYERLGFARPENADAGHIAGVELTYQNYFSRLPAPFDGLGVNLNYTATDSSVRLFERDDELPFFKQSDHIGTSHSSTRSSAWRRRSRCRSTAPR
jgi:hypothetical protein